jgi:hypothetical protein
MENVKPCASLLSLRRCQFPIRPYLQRTALGTVNHTRAAYISRLVVFRFCFGLQDLVASYAIVDVSDKLKK